MADGVQTYRYARPSSLGAGGLDLATSPGHVLDGNDLTPRFFSGFITRPDAFADGLRAMATIAASRWTMMLEDRERYRDPVVTSNGDRLRFESFFACGGVYARLDLLDGVLDGDLLDRGTTNVDVGEPLRRLLARVSPKDALHVGVGADDLTVSTAAETAVERKVPLPTRWLRGFSEVHVVAAGWEPRLELRASEASRFLRSIPTGARGTAWVQPAGRGARLSARAAPGAVAVADARRLAPVLPLLRHAQAVRAYGTQIHASTVGAASGWELDLGAGLRLTVLLSPAAVRGWSAEGASLDSLAAVAPGDDDVLAALSATLAFDARLDLDDLVVRTGSDRAAVRRSVDALGAAGRIGYDLAEAAWFHRELPFDPELVMALNPRLRSAGLVARDAVTPFAEDSWDVRNGDRTYRVRLDGPTSRWSCTCQWWVTHRGERGPCKHVIATRGSVPPAVGEDAPVGVGSAPDARH